MAPGIGGQRSETSLGQAADTGLLIVTTDDPSGVGKSIGKSE